jgi:hypothetical protein
MLQQQSNKTFFFAGTGLLLLMSACSEAPAQSSTMPTEEAVRIELGAGRVDFIPVQDGDFIEVISGPQGGYHLEFTLRLFNVEPANLVLDYQVDQSEQGERLSFPARYAIGPGYVLNRGDHYLRVGDRAILDVESAQEAQGLEVAASCRVERGGVVLSEDKKILKIIDEIDELSL